MKKIIALVLMAVMCMTLFVGCSNKTATTAATTASSAVSASTAASASSAAAASTASASSAAASSAAPDLKVGMVCNAISIDDKSFNQATWEGITRAQKDFGIETKYLIASEQNTEGFEQAISNLYDTGYRMIVTPGYTFAKAIFDAQTMYPDCKFVILDSAPQDDGADQPTIAQNSVGIDYAAQQAGFVAGFACALQLKEGEFGALFGQEITPTKLFKTGFQQGVIYANENYDCKIKMRDENFVWSGSFSDAALGQQITAQLYNSGCNLVYCACGTTALGGFNEAKARAEKGEDVWVVGCDVDQYDDGLLADGSKSVTMTSTMKNLANSTYDEIKAALDGTFVGGQLITFDASNDGVGIPATNPNLSDEVQSEANKILEKIKNGEITVSTDDTDVSAYN